MSKIGVFIGRFQPMHIGHAHVISEALSKVDRLIVLVGSANKARDPKNPFTYEERRSLISNAFAYEHALGRLEVLPLDDYPYSDADWLQKVENLISSCSKPEDIIYLTGYGKDKSSYYLNMFPSWESIQISSSYGTFSASDVREVYLRRLPHIPAPYITPNTLTFLEHFKMTDTFKELLSYKEGVDKDRLKYGTGPFVTVDGLIRWRDKRLLIKRGGAVGKNLYAAPGGFLEPDERIERGMLREVEEETGLLIDPQYIVGWHIFDDPERSLRGRIITHAAYIEIPDNVDMPAPQGKDDASWAGWMHEHAVHPTQYFEDHYHMAFYKGF
jgi:bifunctional NMN adenylyltransferase/nudix hydrolase